MARKKKATQKIKDNLASLVASQTTASIDQGSTLVNGDQESQPESQPAPVISTQSKTPPYTWTQPAELFLIEELKDAIRQGERVENGFHPGTCFRSRKKGVDMGAINGTNAVLEVGK